MGLDRPTSPLHAHSTGGRLRCQGWQDGRLVECKERGISVVVAVAESPACVAQRSQEPPPPTFTGEPRSAAEGASWRRHNFSHFQSLRPASLPRPGGKAQMWISIEQSMNASTFPFFPNQHKPSYHVGLNYICTSSITNLFQSVTFF